MRDGDCRIVWGMPDVPGLPDNPGLLDVPENLVLPRGIFAAAGGADFSVAGWSPEDCGLWLLTGCPPVCFCSVGVTLGF